MTQGSYASGKAVRIFEFKRSLFTRIAWRIRFLDSYSLTYMDEFVDQLLHEERVCDVILPRLTSRYVLEENDELEPRVSGLEGDLESDMSEKE